MNSNTIDLNPARWARVEQLFDDAAELEPAARAKFLDEACADDPELRAYVISLLDSDMAENTLVSDSIRDVLDATLDHVENKSSRVGMRIGPYKISNVVGSGGLGGVYLAERADEQY